ncbi:hypothetical protein [Sulfobacillus thermosulfidooxidans]|uniref:hypothetical protein n=1 Tax=Sulfobacillus thermosulfidooxidans TaxID=28034 RepID=UPI000403F382|nr:hypothetical protein [Sulfobacillus thermosulfidooxidans]
MTWKEALQEAVEERDLAEHAFIHASTEYCDYHIYRLQAAEEKVRLVIRQARAAMGYGTNKLSAPVVPQLRAQSEAHFSGYDRMTEDE